MRKRFKYIYGPVYSWRLGMSLGIDPISQPQKICNYDCSYCQLGKTGRLCNTRRIFVSAKDLLEEIQSFPRNPVDYLTFSGRGEPTLAKNLGEMIKLIKKNCHDKVAVITNGALIDRADVRADLRLADFVLIKLDACDQESFRRVNHPSREIVFQKMVLGIKKFKKKYKGKLGLQMMFIDANKDSVGKMAEIAKNIQPDEIQINTPLRKSPERPLTPRMIADIKRYFKGLPIKCVYDQEAKPTQPLDQTMTKKRHGHWKN